MNKMKQIKKITKGNMYKYFERRRIKQQKKLEAEFDKAFKKFMKEEMYAKNKNYNAYNI